MRLVRVRVLLFFAFLLACFGSVLAPTVAFASDPADSPQPAQAQPAAPPASTQPDTTQPAAADDDDWFHPFFVFVGNLNYNTKSLVPGSWAAFALPNSNTQAQTNISPANTWIGADLALPDVRGMKVAGKIDFTLRGRSPLEPQNGFDFLFADVYLELKNDNTRFAVGQVSDVISPLVPSTLNLYPLSYVPGSLGFYRPMVRGEAKVGVEGGAQLTIQGALAQAIQTFQVSDEGVTRQSGWPDLQGRLAIGIGEITGDGRPAHEVGFSGHFGERDLLNADGSEQFRNTFSFGIDARATFGESTKVQGELFTGQLLGDYRGGIFQTFDLANGEAVRASGGWAELEQKIDEVLLHVGYGVDNVDEADLSAPTGRRQNGNFYANVFYDASPELSLAGELSLWRTRYAGLPTASPVRFEIAVIYKWLGH